MNENKSFEEAVRSVECHLPASPSPTSLAEQRLRIAVKCAEEVAEVQKHTGPLTLDQLTTRFLVAVALVTNIKSPPPIKQNSPDEEKACCLDNCDSEATWECRHGFLYCDLHHQKGAGPCEFKPFRKSKAGQVEEEGK